MKQNRWQWVAAAASAVVALLSGAVRAADAPPAAQEEITIRGQTMKVWPFEDLRARGFEIPELAREDNAFWDYVEAIDLFKDVPQELTAAFDYAFGSTWPSGHDEPLKAFLLEEANQKALTLARQAAARDEFQLYYFGDPQGSIISVLLPSLSHFRQLGKLLVVDGRRLEAQGDYDLALRNYTTAMRMGHHTASGITLIENLVGIAIWTLGDRAVGQMVLRRNLSAEQLEEIREVLADLAPDCPSTRAGMQNERVFGMSIVDELSARPLHLLTTMQGLNGGDGVAAVRATSSGWARLETRVGQLLLPDRTIKRHMAAYYDQLIERAGKPAYDARWSEFDEEEFFSTIPQWNVIARMMLPSLSRANIKGERCRTQAVATRLSVALRLYALENEGQAPARLSDLGPLASPDDLIDPFSGRTFEYDHREAYWRFYSFAENLTDDGGKEGDEPCELDYVVRFPPADVEPFAPDADDADPS